MRGRVLHIVSGDLWGGKETQILLQLVALRKLGWEPELLFFNGGDTRHRFQTAGFRTEILNERAHGLLGLAWEGARLFGANSPQLLVGHGYKETALAFLLSLRLRRPFISVFHGAPEPFTGSAQQRMKIYACVQRVLTRAAARRAVFVSDALCAELGFERYRRKAVVRNVVDVESVRLDHRPHTAAIFESRPAVVIVGRLVAVKGVERALRGIGEPSREGDSAPHLYVIGDGPERERLERLASELGIAHRVHFLGFLKDAAAAIAAADALLITSLREGIPTVLLEALAAGTPIVAHDLPGVRETLRLLPGANYRIVDAASPPAVARALRELLSVPPSRGELPGLVELFSPERAAKELDAIYREAIR